MTSVEIAERYLDEDPETLLETWYDEYHRRTFGIGAKEAASVTGDLRAAFDTWCERSGLHHAVCVDWKYCEQKAKHSEDASLAAALSDFVAITMGHDTKGAFTVAALLVQRGLELVCKCNG